MAHAVSLPVLTAEGGLSRYLEEIRRFPMLEPQEEYMLAKSWREHVFFLRFQHREPPDFLEISGKAVFGSDDRQRRSVGHD